MEAIHLLLTDVVMPNMDGFDLAQKALAIRSDLQILYMSGYANDGFESSDKKNIGNFNFIQKPFNTKVLISKVQEVLST